MTVAALDPGRDKCGLAVLDDHGVILYQEVIATADLETALRQVESRFRPDVLIEGNGTTSSTARERMRRAVPGLCIRVVDEYRTTELAKGEYWKAHPPKGWRRLLPVSMQVPPEPVDDFVAVILARRYLKEGKNHGDE